MGTSVHPHNDRWIEYGSMKYESFRRRTVTALVQIRNQTVLGPDFPVIQLVNICIPGVFPLPLSGSSRIYHKKMFSFPVYTSLQGVLPFGAHERYPDKCFSLYLRHVFTYNCKI